MQYKFLDTKIENLDSNYRNRDEPNYYVGEQIVKSSIIKQVVEQTEIISQLSEDISSLETHLQQILVADTTLGVGTGQAISALSPINPNQSQLSINIDQNNDKLHNLKLKINTIRNRVNL